MKRILLLIAALFFAQPAFAREDVDVNGWTISATPTSCIATMFFVRKTSSVTHVSIQYNAPRKTSYINFSNDEATSLNKGDSVKLKIVFGLSNDVFDTDWGTADFDVAVTESGTRIFSSENFNIQMLDDFGKAKLIAFFVGEELVSAYSLEGSAAAVTELKKCAFEVAGLNPLDPFLK